MGQRTTGNIKLLMAVATFVICRFDKAQEARILTDQELWLCRTLELALLGMASLERTIERERSRMRWVKERDANTKLFQASANGRRVKNFIPLSAKKEKKKKKNFIPRIKVGDEVHTEQARIEAAFSSSFKEL